MSSCVFLLKSQNSVATSGAEFPGYTHLSQRWLSFVTLKMKHTLPRPREGVWGKYVLPELITLYWLSRDTVIPEGGRVGRQEKPWFLLLHNPTQSKPAVWSSWTVNKQLEVSLCERFIVSGGWQFTYTCCPLSSCKWHLRHGNFFQPKKKNLQFWLPLGRGVFWGVFFYASPSGPFNFHFFWEPQGYVLRGLLQTFARGIFSPAPLSCASKILWMFQASPEIARVAGHLFIIKWEMIVAWILVSVVEVSEMTGM